MNLKPFVKWAGGKTRQLHHLTPKIPSKINTYFEPFAGGGAMFLWMLEHKRAENYLISDSNRELIGAYRMVKQDYTLLRELLDQHTLNHSKEYYLSIRDREETCWTKKAARFIYLNKAGFNGLYRVNNSGKFNVPFGEATKPSFLTEEQLCALYEAFNNQSVKFWCCDWMSARLEAKEGDFVYLDPPYYPISDTSFTKYQKDDFTEQDQLNLYNFMCSSHALGVKVMMSNSAAPWILNKYSNDSRFTVETIGVKRVIQASGLSEGVKDVIITNY